MSDPKVPAIRAVLDVLVNWDKRIPPSLREICEGSGVTSTSVVNFYLERLVRLEYVEKVPRISRGVFYSGKPINEQDFIHKKGTRYAVIPQAKETKTGTPTHPVIHPGRRRSGERTGTALRIHDGRNRQPTAG